MQKEDKVEIRMVLQGEVAEKFLRIKKHFMLRNNAEVIRYMVSETYRSLFEPDQS